MQFFSSSNWRLPHCSKSTMVGKFVMAAQKAHEVTNLLEINPSHMFKRDCLASYNVSVLEHKALDKLLWFAETWDSVHSYACSSTILHDSVMKKSTIKLAKRNTPGQQCQSINVFNQPVLDQHIVTVYDDVKNVLDTSTKTKENKSAENIFLAGATFVNILNYGLHKGMQEFLLLLVQYVQNNINLLCLSIHDIYHLDEPPNLAKPRYEEIKKSILQKGSRLFYLVQFAITVHSSCSSTSCSHPVIITTQSDLSFEEQKKAIDTIQKALLTFDAPKCSFLYLSLL